MKKYYYFNSCRLCNKKCSRGAELCKNCANREHSLRMTGTNNSNYNNHKLEREKNPSYKYNISKEILEKYYIEQNLSKQQIANIIKCNVCAITLRLKWYKIKTKSFRELYKNKRFGEKNKNWKGGKSYEIYALEFNNYLKEKIRIRDNYKCQLCNKYQIDSRRKLNIHHIDYNKQNNKENNLISLCDQCHSKTNGKRHYWSSKLKDIITDIYKITLSLGRVE